jgi:hypothetical protein
VQSIVGTSLLLGITCYIALARRSIAREMVDGNRRMTRRVRRASGVIKRRQNDAPSEPVTGDRHGDYEKLYEYGLIAFAVVVASVTVIGFLVSVAG